MMFSFEVRHDVKWPFAAPFLSRAHRFATTVSAGVAMDINVA